MRRLLFLAIVLVVGLPLLGIQVPWTPVGAQVSRLLSSLAADVQETEGEGASSAAASSQGELSQAEVIARIREHMTISTEMKPTVAAVVDVEKLREKNPGFYADAENGDYLVVTQNQAILYSPRRDRIINVSTITLEQAPK